MQRTMQRTMQSTIQSTAFKFYKQSLAIADKEVVENIKTGRALKDIIGKVYEDHRKRVWVFFNFEVTKDNCHATFNVDWTISYNGNVIAHEEDKGHYLDSCFQTRAIHEFAKTICNYQKNGIAVPKLILHSFTTYNKYDEKFTEAIMPYKDNVVEEMNKNLVYTSIAKCDRLPPKKWFSRCEKAYSINADDKLIMRDINFIQTLIPQ